MMPKSISHRRKPPAMQLRLFTLVCASVLLSAAVAAQPMPAHDAPFGLRFGMTEAEVQLPPMPPLDPPKASNTFPFQPANADRIAYHQRSTLLAECARAFDELITMVIPNEPLTRRLLDQFSNPAIVDFLRTDAPQHKTYCASPHKSRFSLPAVSAYRQLRIHAVDINGTKRPVCLLFTHHGLAHIYLSAHDFADVLPDIQARLSQNPAYEQHVKQTLDPRARERLRELPSPLTDGCPPPSRDEVIAKMDLFRGPTLEDRKFSEELEWREMQNRSFAPGDRTGIVERRAWIDRERQLLTASKIVLDRDTSMLGSLKEKTLAAEPGFEKSGPHLFVTDLARRKAVFLQIDRDVAEALSRIVPQLVELDAAVTRQNDATKSEAERSRRSVIDSFK